VQLSYMICTCLIGHISLCYSTGINGPRWAHILFVSDSYPRPNWQIFLLHVKKANPNRPFSQRRIFIFGTLGCFKLGALLEGLRRLMSYKLELHVLISFTDKLFQFINILQYFILNSLDIRNKNSHSDTNEKGSGEVVWPHSYYIFIEYLTGLE